MLLVVIGAAANLLGWDIRGWFEQLWDTMTGISVAYLVAGDRPQDGADDADRVRLVLDPALRATRRNVRWLESSPATRPRSR